MASKVDYAVVVGITRYPDLKVPLLDGPEADAMDFYDWLVDPEGGQLDPNNVTRILSSDFKPPPANAVKRPADAEVESALEAFVDRGNQDGQFGRRLYIYLAGHGISPVVNSQPSLDDAALVTANAANARWHHVSGPTYANWFRAAAFFQEVVLFMDCCREYTPHTPLRPLIWEPRINRPPARTCYALAAEFDRAARAIAWGKAKQIRGLFTLALLSGLRGAACRDRKDAVGSDDLEDYVAAEMRRLAQLRGAAVPNGPTDVTIDLDPRWYHKRSDPIVFRCPSPRFLVTVDVTGANAGRTMALRDGSFTTLNATRQGDHWEWHPPKTGLYELTMDGVFVQAIQLTSADQPIHVTI